MSEATQRAGTADPLAIVPMVFIVDSVEPAMQQRVPSSPSEKHGWRVFGGMMGPVQ